MTTADKTTTVASTTAAETTTTSHCNRRCQRRQRKCGRPCQIATERKDCGGTCGVCDGQKCTSGSPPATLASSSAMGAAAVGTSTGEFRNVEGNSTDPSNMQPQSLRR